VEPLAWDSDDFDTSILTATVQSVGQINVWT
jgi:hypothetical protein